MAPRPALHIEELEHYTTREEFVKLQSSVENTGALLEKLSPKIEETHKSVAILMSEREAAIKSKDRSYALWPVVLAAFVIPLMDLMHFLWTLRGH
jgi:hypothetical protein